MYNPYLNYQSAYDTTKLMQSYLAKIYETYLIPPKEIGQSIHFFWPPMLWKNSVVLAGHYQQTENLYDCYSWQKQQANLDPQTIMSYWFDYALQAQQFWLGLASSKR